MSDTLWSRRGGWGPAVSPANMLGSVSAPTAARKRIERRVQSIALVLDPVERPLWAAAILVAALDVVLTAWGLRAGYPEANPLVAVLVAEVGIIALAALKVGVLSVAAGLRGLRPAWGPWLALGLAIPWAVAVAVNCTVLVAQ